MLRDTGTNLSDLGHEIVFCPIIMDMEIEETPMMTPRRAIAIIGAGPIGLEVALLAHRRGYRVTMFERGDTECHALLQWGSVKLFSPWSMNTSKAGKDVLKFRTGVSTDAPDVDVNSDTIFPSGREFYRAYLREISEHLTQNGVDVRTGAEVVSVSRAGLSKGQEIGTAVRASAKFNILVRNNDYDKDDEEEELLEGFDAVIDASGSYGNHNYMGRGGIPAVGERALAVAREISYTIPSFFDGDRDEDGDRDANVTSPNFLRVPNKVITTLVVGSGASAITSVNALLNLKHQRPPSPATATAGNGDGDRDLHKVVWVTRRPNTEEKPLYARVANDPLPMRDALYRLGNGHGDAPALQCANTTADGQSIPCTRVHGVGVVRVARIKDSTGVPSSGKDADTPPYRYRVTVADESAQPTQVQTIDCHNVVANVGYRPDTSPTEELQVHYCYATQGPMKLAASLMAAGGGGDCLSQVAPGKETLRNPEPRLYIIGMKSYGRGSAFLLRIGYEQAAQVMDLLAEDFK